MRGSILVNSQTGSKNKFVIGIRRDCHSMGELQDYVKVMAENGFDFDCKTNIENFWTCSSAKTAEPKELAGLLLKLEDLGFEYQE